MLNIEKYKDLIKENIKNSGVNEVTYVMLGNAMSRTFYSSTKRKSAYEILDWLCEEYKEPILTDEEREYLKVVFKPFASRISTVRKVKDCDRTEYLEISVKSLVYNSYEYISLASYLPNTIYKNMEVDEPYTLEELGIEYGDEE